MAYLDKIKALNNYIEDNKIPFIVDGVRVGQIKKEYLELCKESVFNFKDGKLYFKDKYNSFSTRSYALDILSQVLIKHKVISKIMNEKYALLESFNSKPYALLDRAISTFLGVLSFGQHLNGYVKKEDTLYMWIGVRAKDKGYCGGMLDHLVAGGLPWGISLKENLTKECYEEAGISKELANRAKSTSIISYRYEYELGGKEDIIFCYDLKLGEDFKPVCTDGEVEEFILMPISEVANIVKSQWRFKPNCNLVIIDFLVRWGYITPKDKDYIDIIKGLRL